MTFPSYLSVVCTSSLQLLKQLRISPSLNCLQDSLVVVALQLQYLLENAVHTKHPFLQIAYTLEHGLTLLTTFPESNYNLPTYTDKKLTNSLLLQKYINALT